MIKVTTECTNCAHAKVCKNKDNALHAAEKLKKMTYGSGPNNDYDWDTMSNHLGFDVAFSCPDFTSGVVWR